MAPMLDNDRPDMPFPELVEYAEDPDLDDIWPAMSALYMHDDEKPPKHPPPCEKYNKDVCYCRSTCPHPHVCSICFQPGHYVFACPRKAESVRARHSRNKMMWDEDASYSPCSLASLDAPPLPRPPPPSELPPELVRVVRERPKLFQIVTPIRVDVFEGLLASHPNQEFVKSVIIGLREGFWPFANPPRVLVDESWRQKRLHGRDKDFLERHVKEEVDTGRFSQPFGKMLLPGMTCMPVQVEQRERQKKPRLIYDHSSGDHSLNSLIPKSERGASYDRIDALLRILRDRRLKPADIVLFKSDVSHAYRILPMSPYWQALQAVKVDGSYYIDRCNCPGNAGSQRLFCSFYSLILWIAENIWGITDIFSYVDDNFSWDDATQMKYYPRYNKYFPEKQARLLEIWDYIGVPHALEKQEFSPALSIVGFRVDLRNMRVTRSHEYLQILVKSLLELCDASSMTVPLLECQKLAGSINWIFDVNPLLRPGIVSLHKAMSKSNQSNGSVVTLTEQVVSDLKWLARLLQKSKGVHLTRIRSWGPKDASQVAYIYASDEGFGIWYPLTKQAFYYRYGIQAQDSFISAIHTFVMVCAIYRATKLWKKTLDDGPRRLAIFTLDKLTVSVFDKLRAPDELHHVLLLAIELLAEADTDYLVSEPGNGNDMNFAARLSRESKEVLDLDYPDVTLREFIIPPHLASRFQWDLAPTSCVSSRL